MYFDKSDIYETALLVRKLKRLGETIEQTKLKLCI